MIFSKERLEVYWDLRKMGPCVIETQSEIRMFFNGETKRISNWIFDRYLFLQKAENQEIRERRLRKLKQCIKLDWGPTQNWADTKQYISSLDDKQFAELAEAVKNQK